MDLITFVIAWLLSVTGMTLFSIAFTKLSRYEMREHLLLGKLIFRLIRPNDRESSIKCIGWIVHFGVGLLFLYLFEILWELTGFDRRLVWSVVFGVLLGVIGVIGWKLIFHIHPKKPKINFRLFYLNIIIAHIIFSVIALLVYQIAIR